MVKGHADGLNAQLNADQIAAGDTVQLTLSGDLGTLTEAPNLAPLAKDFDILGQSQSRQTQILNGTRSDQVAWVLTLQPKRQGTLAIPALNAGAASSAPLHLKVLDPAKMPMVQVPGAPALDVTVAPGPYYIQQNIPVTLRITSGPNLLQGELSLPQTGDYTLTQSGDDRVSQTSAQGVPVTVLERSYILQPQKSGVITLDPIALRARLLDPNAPSAFGSGGLDSFFANTPFAGQISGLMAQQGSEVTVRSAPIVLNVKAAPLAKGEWFLPANNVRLSAEWQPAKPTFKPGEAVTRMVRIEALGATEVQLPDLDPGTAEGARIYLDGSGTRTVDLQDGKAALREFHYSIVPTQRGQITLPEIRLNWFDIASQTQKIAVLPAETITVTGAPLVAASAAKGAQIAAATSPPIWPEMAFAALIGALALGIAAVILRRPAATRPIVGVDRRAAIERASAAITAGNAPSAHGAVSLWLRLAARDLGMRAADLPGRFPHLCQLTAALEQQLYDPAAQSPRHTAANTALITALRTADAALLPAGGHRGTKPSALRPLYRPITATAP